MPDVNRARVGILRLPLAGKPNVARVRAPAPVAWHPDPLTTPIPIAGEIPPLREKAGTGRNDIRLIFRWRLGGRAVNSTRVADLRPDIHRTLWSATGNHDGDRKRHGGRTE